MPEQSFVRTLQDLHFDLPDGSRGRLVYGVGALVLLGMCVTGLVIWWPGTSNWTRSLMVDFSRQWRRVNWDLHSGSALDRCADRDVAASGAYFVFPTPFRLAVNRVSPLTRVATPQSKRLQAVASRPSWRALVNEVQRRVPGQHLARVVLPSSNTSPFL